jgi:mannitol/fructose-specific phosphotransferase system IIA component (Ntr-type)
MVRLTAYLAAEHIHLDVDARDKDELLRQASLLLAPHLTALDAEAINELLLARERLASTGVGHGIAIPHASSAHIDTPCLGLFRTAQPVPFDAVDDQPVRLMVVVLAPQHEQALHLRLLAGIARLVRSEAVRDTLLAAQTAEEAYSCVGGFEGTA